MKYLLDTDICVYLLNGEERLKRKVGEVGIYSISICNATLGELFFGAFCSKKVTANLRRIHVFADSLTIHSDSLESSEIFGRTKADLKKSGQLIEDFDLLIASIAQVNDCILVTNNRSHFNRIEGLVIQNWLED